MDYITANVTKEILDSYPDLLEGSSFDETLINCVSHVGNRMLMIIDEWDAPIRETPEIEEAYLKFLRMLFKGSGTTSRIFAAAYMTGILPIKKDGNQSAVSDFEEYTVLAPGGFADFVGFTEKEVKMICENRQIDFDKMKQWYDGYTFGDMHSVYNPYSVMHAVKTGKFKSY